LVPSLQRCDLPTFQTDGRLPTAIPRSKTKINSRNKIVWVAYACEQHRLMDSIMFPLSVYTDGTILCIVNVIRRNETECIAQWIQTRLRYEEKHHSSADYCKMSNNETYNKINHLFISAQQTDPSQTMAYDAYLNKRIACLHIYYIFRFWLHVSLR